MHPLLLRQIRKHIPQNLAEVQGFQSFLDVISRSYENFDDKLSMMQRATKISSEELQQAKEAINQEAERQQRVLASLEKAMNSLNSEVDHENEFRYGATTHIDAEKLSAHISNLAIQIAEITAEKNVLLKDLEAQNESLNNYAHAVSHDLKSPIRNISALMNWIVEVEKINFSEESVTNCTLIEQNLNKMDRLIENILKHATVETLEEEKAHIDIRELLEEIKSTVYLPPNITIRLCAKLPVLYVQKYRIEQLFTNLITNAITATEHRDLGVIKIDFQEDDVFWRFSCSDNGKGIAEKHRSSIFEMFNKLENDFNATGIGLALVKKIINFYEGDIWIESEENKGTTFFFTLKK